MYDKTLWSGGDVIYASGMNNLETQYDTVKTDIEAGDFAIPAISITSGALSVERIPVGAKQLFLGAGSGTPQLTNGCAGQLLQETSGNKQNYITLDFDHITNEYVQWSLIIPDGYAASNFTAQFAWTAASGSGNVRWGIQMAMVGNGDAIDTPWGTAVEINQTLDANLDFMVTDETGDITPSGTLEGGKFLFIRVYRDAEDTVNDTLPADAKLLGVKLKFDMNYTDEV